MSAFQAAANGSGIGGFNGLGMNLGNLSRLSQAKTRSISPENFDGAKGGGARATEGTGANCARDLGIGWKLSPSVVIKPGETFPVADITGSGAIQQIWMTPAGDWRRNILRMYWDGQEQPSVACPVGDFFASGWGSWAQLSSLAVCVNPGSAFNCYWEMPFCQTYSNRPNRSWSGNDVDFLLRRGRFRPDLATGASAFLSTD